MNDLTMFEGQHEVFILLKGDVKFDFKGDFLIRAKDVAAALEYKATSATTEVLKFVKSEQAFTVKNSDIAIRNDRKLNNAGETFITNLGLNRVFGKSGQPKAEPFQDWLYEDILPSVQSKGAYLTPDTIEKTLSDPDFIIKLATEMKSEREKRIFAEKQAALLASKASYVDTILQSKGLVTITQIAKDYGFTGPQLNKLLETQGIQYKINKQWVLYKKYANKGYTQSYSFPFNRSDGTPEIKMNTQWTQRGRLFIHEMLTGLGIKANIEKEFDEVN